MSTVLFIEDDLNVAFMLTDSLEENGYKVTHRTSGDQVAELLLEVKPDVAILDVVIDGDANGFEVGRKIRSLSDIPILFTTSRTEIKDLKEGFEIGNVDYLKKPYSISELLMRLNELLKKQAFREEPKRSYTLGDLVFNIDMQTLSSGYEQTHLKSQEAILLELLCKQQDTVTTKQMISLAIWDEEDPKMNEASINNLIYTLRTKLEEHSVYIRTIAKKGYKLETP